MMRAARVIVVALAWLLSATTAVHAAAPLIRVEVRAKQPVLVGQQIPVDVTVMAPNFFTSAPPFPTLQVPGTIITMPDEHASLGTEVVAGETYARVQKTYIFAAQQAGDFTLPPVKIDFTYGGDDGKPLNASVTMPATRITARLPAGAAAPGGSALPVARLTVQQSFDRSTADLKAGDALIRTVDIFASQTQAMMIPPPHFEAPDGVRVFVADPVIDDESKERAGFQGGHRIDHVTYVFEKAGRYTLPAVELRWFDAASNKPQTAQAPAVTVTVAAGAHAGETIAPEAIIAVASSPSRRQTDWPMVTGVVVALGLLGAVGWFAWRRWPRWQARWRARRAAHEVSDAVMFRRLLEACSRNDAKAAHGRLLDWCRTMRTACRAHGRRGWMTCNSRRRSMRSIAICTAALPKANGAARPWPPPCVSLITSGKSKAVRLRGARRVATSSAP